MDLIRDIKIATFVRKKLEDFNYFESNSEKSILDISMDYGKNGKVLGLAKNCSLMEGCPNSYVALKEMARGSDDLVPWG